MTIHEGNWSTRPNSDFQFPQRITLTEEQQENILKNLRSVGIEVDIFATPRAVIPVLTHSKDAAIAVFAAIKHEVRNETKITMRFSEWSRALGLPW